MREFGSNGSYNNGKENVTSYIIHKCSSLLNSASTRQKFSHPEDEGSIFFENDGRNGVRAGKTMALSEKALLKQLSKFKCNAICFKKEPANLKGQ